MRITGKLFKSKNQLLLKKAIEQKTHAVDVTTTQRRNVLSNELNWLKEKDKAIGIARILDTARTIRQLERGPLSNHALDETIRYFNLGPC